MKAIRLTLAVLFLLAAVATPGKAIIITCGDVCTCTSVCGRTCRDDNSLQWTTCGNYGVCRDIPNC